MKRSIILLILGLFCTFGLKAQSTDSIRLSLLTCGAGNEIYSLFGHTAIRYENPARSIDVVFNYGMFSFNVPNFALRFALGQTDYQLGVVSYEHFVAEYTFAGRDVWQQTLNLLPQEKIQLAQQLEENYRPENRMYRYNFFYDNCSTRPRDQIESAVSETLVYAQPLEDTNTGKTFRDLIHQYTHSHPWAGFGIDLCIGSEADLPINRRQMMFAPFYLKDFFDKAMIKERNGSMRPLVSATQQVVEIADEDRTPPHRGITPMQLSLLLFIAVAGATAYGLRRQKSLWAIDLLLFVVAGTVGCVIAFLMFFSTHPAVSANYLLIIFHPLHLLCLPCAINKVRKGKRSYYLTINCAILTLFIVLWPVIPQEFDRAVLPLALCLLIRSANHLILTYKKR